ncbi:MAG: peptidylprolyl isomerase [Myxococcales bacterium]|nr:peptidylprolyl isomerase [Myxococcales bacterium]MDH3485489.1 peptidylprolyl isomerase [Myxococcales bacterium]
MLRPLLHFFLIGALLFAGKIVFESRDGDPPEITVRMPADSTEAQVEKEIRNQILLNEARRYGWYRTDPIVFTHLVRNMRFIEPDTGDDDLTLFKRALQMNMQEHDPVVRARLLYRAREALTYVPEDRMPTREELEEHRAAHEDRFEREGKVRFEHVFLSGTKRGEALASDAVAMSAQLEALGNAAPTGRGDPLPGLRAVQSSTVSQIRASYGEELAGVIDEGVVGSWRGPVPSVYGVHFVRVLEKEPSSVPALTIIEAEVRADLLSEIKEELSKERMEALRNAYVVHVERIP